jgi:lysozyme
VKRIGLAVAVCLLVAAPAAAKTVVCPQGATIPGIDVSYWQGTIDWAKVKAAGKKYAIMRAAHALKADTKFDFNWKQCHVQGLRCGVYQYFEPNIDPIAQANLMLKMMGKLGPGDLPPVIDVESKAGMTPAAISAAIKKWIDHVEKAVGRKPMIYTGAYFWEDYVKSTAWVSYPLWHAQYCSNCCPNIANPWKTWHFWQHSSTGKVSGIAGNVDLDLWNGEQKALDAFAVSTKPPPPTCKPACEGSVVVAADCSKGDCAKFAAYCSTVAAPLPKCVSVFCVKDAGTKPVAKDVCLPDGKRAHCEADGDLTPKPCAIGQNCKMVNGAAVCDAPVVEPTPDAGTTPDLPPPPPDTAKPDLPPPDLPPPPPDVPPPPPDVPPPPPDVAKPDVPPLELPPLELPPADGDGDGDGEVEAETDPAESDDDAEPVDLTHPVDDVSLADLADAAPMDAADPDTAPAPAPDATKPDTAAKPDGVLAAESANFAGPPVNSAVPASADGCNARPAPVKFQPWALLALAGIGYCVLRLCRRRAPR